MRFELVTKNERGFALTQSGESAATQLTAKKLVRYYLIKGLGVNPDAAKGRMAELGSFIDGNFHTITEGLPHLDELAHKLGEENAQKFRSFMGKHFVTTLEKEKSALIEREGPAAQAKFDNPHWTPSVDLLLLYGRSFEGTPPIAPEMLMKSSFSEEERESDEADDKLGNSTTEIPAEKPETAEKEAAPESMVGNSTTESEIPPIQVEVANSAANLPGVKLLEFAAPLFQDTPPLDHANIYPKTLPNDDTNDAPTEGEAEESASLEVGQPAGESEYDPGNQPEEFQSIDESEFEAAQEATAPPEVQKGGETAEMVGNSTPDKRLPGLRLLDEVKAEFEASPKLTADLLQMGGSSTGQSPDQSPGQSPDQGAPQGDTPTPNQVDLASQAKPASLPTKSTYPQQISLEVYAKMVNAIRKFTKTKDQAGYKSWYSQLRPTLKGAIKVQGLINSEDKGNQVDWAATLNQLAGDLQLEGAALQRIAIDIRNNKKTLASITDAIRQAGQMGAPAAQLQALYGKTVSILTSPDTLETKRSTLQMLCLGIDNESARLKLQAGLFQLLDDLD